MSRVIPRRRRSLRRPAVGLALVAPAVAIALVFFFVPLGLMIFMSFQDWPLLRGPQGLVGTDNYVETLTAESFLTPIGFTVSYAVISTAVMFLVASVLVGFAASPRRGARLYRATFFLPFVVGLAPAALIWLSAINDQTGAVNYLLQGLGLTDGPFGFLSTPEKAILTTVTLLIWKTIGFTVIILTVGVQSVPHELYEAARVDGANVVQRLRYITVPFLKPTLALLFILSITGGLLAFDQFNVLTQGRNDTVTVVYAIVNMAFQRFDLGKAAAMAVVVMIALVAVNVVQLYVLRKREAE